jgi:hypothetical protein
MGVKSGPRVVKDGLVFSLDAAVLRSYSGSGDTAYSLVSGIGATLVNGTGFSSFTNGSFFFDGTNDYIISSLADTLIGSNITWIVWYKSSSDTAQTLISKSSLSTNTSFDLAVGPATITLTNELITIVGIDNNNRVGYVSANRNELFDNQWHQIVLVANSVSYILYLDGRSLTLTVGLGSNNGDVANVANALIIGAWNRQGTLGTLTNGNISQVQIYNRALTAQEILQNYNATKGRYR